MIEKDKDFFYLSSSIAAVLVASRLSICSLKNTIVFMFVVLNLEIVFGILAARYGYGAFTFAALLIAASTLLWAAFQVSRAFRIERELHSALLLWSKELGELSGDLVDIKGAHEDDQEKIAQKIRVIQRFLELLTSAGQSSA